MDLACITKTWIKEGEMVALQELPPPISWSFINPELGKGAILIQEEFFFSILPVPKVISIDCASIMWENLTICMVY